MSSTKGLSDLSALNLGPPSLSLGTPLSSSMPSPLIVSFGCLEFCIVAPIGPTLPTSLPTPPLSLSSSAGSFMSLLSPPVLGAS